MVNDFVVDVDVGSTPDNCPPIPTESWCYTQVEEDKEFEHAWTIEKFGKIIELYPAEKTLYSKQFTVPIKNKDTVWRLKVYPNGRKADDSGYVTIFLKDSGKEEPNRVHAHVEFSVINAMGEKMNLRNIDKEFKVAHHAFGFSKYLKHTDLFNPAKHLLPDGKLTFHCKIIIKVLETSTLTSPTVSEERKSDVKSITSNIYKKQMSELLSDAKNLGADITFQCSDGEVPCHSSILSVRSPVFKAMFSHKDTSEKKTGCVALEDVDKSTCLLMLKFMYTGEVLHQELGINLLIAADKYDVQDLKELCEKKLLGSLCVTNCVEILIIGDRYNSSVLRSGAKTFIIDNSNHLCRVPEWKEMLVPHPALLAEILEGVISSPPQAKRRKVDGGHRMQSLVPYI